jgi:hypothetical protein
MKLLGMSLGFIGVTVVITGGYDCAVAVVSWMFVGRSCATTPILVGLAMIGAGALMAGKFPRDSH